MKKTTKVTIDGDSFFVKKGFSGYRVTHPIRNEDGTRNWKHLIAGGSWWNLLIVAFMVLIILGVVWEYRSNVNRLLECIQFPFGSQYCVDLKNQLTGSII